MFVMYERAVLRVFARACVRTRRSVFTLITFPSRRSGKVWPTSRAQSKSALYRATRLDFRLGQLNSANTIAEQQQ